jgi:hypothetical protein
MGLTSCILIPVLLGGASGAFAAGPSDPFPVDPTNTGPADSVTVFLWKTGTPVPYTEAHALGPEALPLLEGYLREERWKTKWVIIVHAINFIGDPAGFPALRDFLFNRFGGEVDHATFEALYCTVSSMGPLAARSDSAFQFLVSGTDPSYWTRVHWKDPNHKGGAEYQRVWLSELSIMQLGLSGRPEAVAVLKKLQGKPHSKLQIDDVKEAIQLQREVEDVGPDRYYERLGKPNPNGREMF